MRLAYLFAWILGSCTTTPPEELDCSGKPDFDVIITALDAALPGDTVVRLAYGGGEDEYRLASPGTPEVLFCSVADREGNSVDAGRLSGAAGRGSGGESGDGGAASTASAEALRCRLWTDGPAELSVETESYPNAEPLELMPRSGACTVEKGLELVPPDGGV